MRMILPPKWLGAAGIAPLRETSTVRKGVRQVIFRPGAAIVELVGSARTAGRPAEVGGLTLVTADVDATHAALPATTKPPWDAVQPGRRMTVLRHEAHGMSVAMAFMSPHVKGLEGSAEARDPPRRLGPPEIFLGAPKNNMLSCK